MEDAHWLRLEEIRRYEGASEHEVASAFRMQLEEALGEGYLPASLAWSSEAGQHVLTVTYEYDPARAPRPV